MALKALILELLPHAPQMGLFVAPHIPSNKLRNALRDYATSIQEDEVLALFDATLMGSAKDGAVFGADTFVFQNNDLEPTHVIRYTDIVGVEKQRGFIKGTKILLEVNRGRATFEVKLDMSARTEAQDYLFRFLHEAMLLPEEVSQPTGSNTTKAGSDRNVVMAALDRLRDEGTLVEEDYRRLVEAIS